MRLENVTFSAVNRFVREPSIFVDPEPGVELPDWGFDLDLPYDQLCVFARHLDTAAPIARMPLFGLAVLDLSDEDRQRLDGVGLPEYLMAYPLGVVGTDHVGYGSFDLWVLRHIPVAERIKLILEAAGVMAHTPPRPRVVLRRLLVFPYKDPKIAFDAIKEGEKAPDFICLRMDLDATMVANRAEWPPMPAMQTPSILDCRLSPGSFSMSGALVIGEDGCETLLPRNLATQLIRFQQLVKTASSIGATSLERGLDGLLQTPDLEGAIFLGHRIEFRTEWFPLGHSLGEIAYSLPMAPGEKIQIAVIDWARQDEASRDEKTSLSEQLQHDTYRERSIAESVQMVVAESQEGSSFMAGAALSAGAGIPLGAVSLGVGAALGIGGASSSSSGVRNIAGNTAQNISDAFHQASSALRELNSTVVVQSSQAESATAKTRVIVNHNHSHALTMLYYEVLRHYRLLTRPSAIKPVLFLKHKTPQFDYVSIFKFRNEIAASLIDPGLKDCLAVIEKRHCLEINLQRVKDRLAKQGDPLDDTTLGQFTVTFTTGAVPPALLSNVEVWLIPVGGGAPIQCNLVDNSMTPTLYSVNYPHVLQNLVFGQPEPRIAAGSEFTYALQPVGLLHWKHVQAIRIDQTITPANSEENPDLRPWNLDHLRVVTESGANKWVMVDAAPPSTVPHNGSVTVPVNGFVPPVDNVDDLLSDDEFCCLNRVLAHINSHKAYYWQAVWRNEKPADRALRLRNWKVGDFFVGDLIENKLLDTVDDCVVFPIAAGAEAVLNRSFDVESISAASEPFADYVEQILTLPARGVFAEAKLGNCNASELIDPTRFWDWQTSPIPDEAPTIAPTSTQSRAEAPTGLTPTPFPASLINIVNPSAAPDPAGFSTAGSVLSSLGQFRDMSGMSQLGAYLQTLSNNATSLAQQGMKNANTAGLMNMINGSDQLTQQQKGQLIHDLLAGQVKDSSDANKAKTDAPADATKKPGGDTPANPGGGQNPASPATPAKPKADTPVPADPPKNTPKPAAAPVPVKPVALSDKTRKLTFAFAYDTDDVLTGRWRVAIQSGADFREEQRLTDTVTGEEGVDIGDRMEMYVDSGFGGTEDVKVQLTGTILADVETIGAGAFVYQTKGWSVQRTLSATIKRADFDTVSTIRFVQPTVDATYTVTTTAANGHASSEATTGAAGLLVGSEAAVQFDENGIVANGQPNVRISAKGTIDTTVANHATTPVDGGIQDVANFAARKIDGDALTISLVDPNVIVV